VKDRISLAGGGALRGVMRVPGDKSISHRALIFNGLAEGEAFIEGLLDAEDVHATAACLRALGVSIEGAHIRGVNGKFSAPVAPLDCGNSGTTIRLLMGALAGQKFRSELTGDASLRARPMARVADPLATMGVQFEGHSSTPPIVIQGATPSNIQYCSPVASAQVKTALMLAAIQGRGTLRYEEPACSRDHTERMFTAMGIEFERTVTAGGAHRLTLKGPQTLQACSLEVPGDISSAAFFIVAATILPGSDLLIENVGINPTRTGVLDVLRRMGATIEETNRRTVSGEPVADLRVQSADLVATTIEGNEIPRLVDELPVLGVAAAEAHGKTCVRDAKELRVKESDRIACTAEILRGRGVDVSTVEDGFDVQGRPGSPGKAFTIAAQGDHRIAMAAVIAALRCEGTSTIRGSESMQTSFPQFMGILEKLRV